MELKRVVVTGIGAITPIGNNVNDLWDALVNGVSGTWLLLLKQYQIQVLTRVLSTVIKSA